MTRRGMTLVELLVAVVVLGFLGHAVWVTAHTAGSSQLARWRASSEQASLRAAERAIRRALDAGAAGGLSFPNLGAVDVRPADGAAGARDTLVVLIPDRPAAMNSAEPCVSTVMPCLTLLGEQATAFVAGEVVVVGAPRLGGRLAQIAAVRSMDAPCGADCAERLRCQPQLLGDVSYLDVGGADFGEGVLAGQTCDQPFSLGGACRETLVVRTVRPQMPVCEAVGGGTVRRTEVDVVDRSGLSAGLAMANVPLRSAGAMPLVRTQRVVPVRFWLREDSLGGPALVRQRGLSASGAWNEPVVVAAPIAEFRVESMHRDTAEWVRGTGVTAAMLTPGDANRIRHLTATPDAPAATGFARSYATIGAVRIALTVPRTLSDGGVRRETFWIVHGLTANLEGGIAPAW